MMRYVRKIQKELDDEEDEKIESLIKDGFLDDACKIANHINDVEWKTYITEANILGENGLYIPKDVSRKCFGNKHDSVKMVDLEAGKGYKCVIHRDGRDEYEKKIGRGWYKYARENRIHTGDLLFFTMTPMSDVMHVQLVKG
ncbi:unnamed protein product [Lathyrus sativus]|nr:unnamed protein product [Lathyrus sativus]